MIWIWSVMILTGLILVTWAYFALPEGTDMIPRPPVKRIETGPYRLMKHPMYFGNLLFISGCAGIAAGIWNAIAMGSVTELIHRYWIRLEEST